MLMVELPPQVLVASPLQGMSQTLGSGETKAVLSITSSHQHSLPYSTPQKA